jgi:hypothetical protein
VLPYFLAFLFAVSGYLLADKAAPGVSRLWWFLYWLFFSFFLGLRDRVGADWGIYELHFNRVANYSFLDVVSLSDPAYYFLNWVAARLGAGLYLANLACAMILVYGVVKLARTLRYSPVAGVVAVPYLFVVVGMGYTRQSVAVGLFLVGLAHLSSGRKYRYAILAVIGSAFHKSAVVTLPLMAVIPSGRRYVGLFVAVVSSVAGVYYFVADSLGYLSDTYLSGRYESEGGFIRVAMNFIPSVAYLIWGKRVEFNPVSLSVWRILCVLSLATVPLVFFASTATDRIALYLIAIQLYVIPKMSLLFRSSRSRAAYFSGVSLFYGLVLIVWLNFASHSSGLLPYQSVLLK